MNIPKDNHSTAHITRIHFTSSSLMAGYVVPLGSTIKNTACYPPRQPSFYQLLSQLCYQKSPIHPLLVRNHSFLVMKATVEVVTGSDDTLLVLTSAGPAYVMVTVLSLFLGLSRGTPSSKPWMTMSSY
jgi:hypothetical protein